MKKNLGFGIVEVIVAMSIFIIIAVTAVTTIIGSFSTNRLGDEETKATLIAQEGLEAARSIKNQGWANPFLGTLCTSGCGVSISGGVWSWLGSSNTSGNFTRIITVANVQRNGGSDIVTSGGTDDPDTKKVTSTVTWNFTPARNNTVSLATYLTNFRKAIGGDWSSPLADGSLDLTAGNSGAAAANGNAIAYSGNYAYLGRATSGGREIYAIDASNSSAPTLCANCQRELGGNVNDIEISGNYAYMASSNNAQELQIIDISSPTSLNTATLTILNLTAGNSGNDNADAVAVAVSGTTLYMIRNGGNEFISFNIATPTSPSINGTGSGITGVPSDMVIVGSYAFVTSDDNAAELQVINLSTLNRDAVFNLNSGNNNANALSVIYAGSDRLLIGRASSAAPELYSINISTPTSPSLASTVEIGNDVVDISFGNNLIFLATNNNAADFLVINGSNLDSLPALPAFGQLNIEDSPQDLTYEASVDRVFVASSSDTTELQIIMPQ